MDIKKILITGGAGFVGTHLANSLIENYEVMVFDNLSAGSSEGLDGGVKFRKVDLLDNDQFQNEFKKFKPDTVFHLAAKSSRDPHNLGVLDNIKGTLNALVNCQKYPPKKFIFTSSASVYGNATKLPINENETLNPISTYGLSKMVSESLIRSMLGFFNIPYSILRLSNVYGPGQRSDNEGGIVSILCNKLNERKAININSSGKQTRDFVFINDVIEAMKKSVKIKSNIICNVSSGTETSINELIRIGQSVSGKKINVNYLKESQPEIKRSVLRNSKAKIKLGWSPFFNLEKGLAETYYFYKEYVYNKKT